MTGWEAGDFAHPLVQPNFTIEVNLKRYLAGEPVLNIVDREKGYPISQEDGP